MKARRPLVTLVSALLMLLAVSCQHPQPTNIWVGSRARQRIGLMQMFPNLSPEDALRAYPDLTTMRDEELRLREIYRSAFTRGFQEAWEGHWVVIDPWGSTDPDGEWALIEGHADGRQAGSKARLAYEIERAKNEEH